MKLGARHLADYGSIKSRHDFMQRQLMCCLILKTYLKTTYRGVVDLLDGHAGLRKVLGMEDKLPHYTTLQKFGSRSQVLEVAEAMLAQLGGAGLRQAGPQAAVAVDATGLETTNASAHFVSRAGRKRSKFKKLSVSVVCGALLPLALVVGWGPGNDKTQAFELLAKTFEAAEAAAALPSGCMPMRVMTLTGSTVFAGRYGRSKAGSNLRAIRPTVAWGGVYRGQMTGNRLKREGYGRRWHVASFFSALKRMTGSTLASRTETTMINEAAFKVLAYALHR